MASIRLNKTVTIAWRDGKNYKINAGTETMVPNNLVDYIITSQYYIGSILSFKKDEEFIIAPVIKKEEPVVVMTIKEDPSIVDVTSELVVPNTTNIQPIVSEEDADKKQLDILSQLMEKSKSKTTVKSTKQKKGTKSTSITE